MFEMKLMDTREKILEATIKLFNEKGLKFTMDDIAAELSMSKKTIYTVFADKTSLFYDMVDYIFDQVKESEEDIMEDPELDTVEKLRRILIVLPDRYEGVDFRKLYLVREKYPAIYAKIAFRLESGWESTFLLLEQGIREGKIRKVPFPVVQAMVAGTIEQYLNNQALIESGISYTEALKEMVEILMKGIQVTQE